jgi:hypothetical protein
MGFGFSIALLSSRMLKNSASLSCSFGLFGLSGQFRLFDCLVSLGQATKQTRWTRPIR